MPTDAARRFVTQIAALCEEPGARAALRSGLGRTVNQAERLHRYLAPWTASSQPHREAVRYTIASLIAVNPDHAIPTASPGNLGASIAACYDLADTTRERSVHLLARQPASQLCRMLTRIVVPLRTCRHPVGIDFAALIDDADHWPQRRAAIGRRWLQTYYRISDPITDARPGTPTAESNADDDYLDSDLDGGGREDNGGPIGDNGD